MTAISRRGVCAAGTTIAAMAALRLRPAAARDAVRPALPIPQELRPDARGEIAFTAEAGATSFMPGARTATYGYNGPFLGPALRLRRGETVTIDFTNNLPVPTTVHWHGLVIPGDVDGGPHRPVAPGQHWRPALSVDQPAATLWFHPHFYPTTAAQVTKGLAGLLIIDDEDADRLALPSRWGVNDIPLIIQDRRFGEDGQFFDRMNITAVTSGYVGDVPLVNGVRYPEARVARGWARLRLLDGSNARSYMLTASDGRPLFVIGSDGGLLESPVELKQIMIHAGERFEIMVDCRSGAPFDLVTLPVGEPIMRLPPFDDSVPLVTIRPDGADMPGQLPASLANLPQTPAELPPISQQLVMKMFRDEEGMMPLMKAGLAMGKSGKIDAAVIARVTKLIVDQPELSEAAQLSANGVNGRPFALDEPLFAAPRNQPLRWRISEGDDQMLHPVHIHGCQFRILSERGQPPEAYRAGWKDIAPISAGGYSDILVSFPYPADPHAPYMAHCHILEHEDSGMMAQFTVA
ncbi:multicopper oxidase type 3 [Methylocella silvestris BL2]|uniref:Multicopper oxidase CueO n=1 Tax=Methylocella silvestris (strain DSM 15510 / CIP 108128 / LMG 27833 / NCIMB 13906 / BL2) TaxID=395965 RepID=B8ET71_METSB|nr:multicopper oxidase CueO [Methylocella silvestris]ACK51209.1 multicopper oxidase type 3 [Methylocella silvestris BL2]